jgi:hypothetical protein
MLTVTMWRRAPSQREAIVVTRYDRDASGGRRSVLDLARPQKIAYRAGGGDR